jgi:hypothetical protein
VKSTHAKVLIGHLKDTTADDSNDRKPPAKTSPTNIPVEMHAKTEELAVVNLTHPPEKIWWMEKNWADKKCNAKWYGMKEHQVRELVRKARTKLGFGSFLSTMENIPDYRLMTDTNHFHIPKIPTLRYEDSDLC